MTYCHNFQQEVMGSCFQTQCTEKKIKFHFNKKGYSWRHRSSNAGYNPACLLAYEKVHRRTLSLVFLRIISSCYQSLHINQTRH